VVVIGRNEGERLVRCLNSVRPLCDAVVYVDSGSSDDSVPAARRLGVEVVELDLAVPFTAARARNEGFRRLRELHPGVECVQFVDGDCELVPGWIPAALRALLELPTTAVVCGRRRERFRDATLYNRLCDLEWDTPVGEAEACGGDALMRATAFERAGGFDPSLIAGEEPDLCFRLRGLGYRVLRIEADMTLHDASMTRIGQWWRRMMRGGYAAANSCGRRGTAAPRIDRRSVRGAIVWVVALPIALLIWTWLASTRGTLTELCAAPLIAVGLVCVQIARIALRRPSPGNGAADAWLYGASCMAAKLPQSLGMIRYLRDRARRQRPVLIEYK
jgi:glycosyltransferase involved in cell wall biosynthesis